MGFKVAGDLKIDPDKPVFKVYLTNVGKHEFSDEHRKLFLDARSQYCHLVIGCRSIYQDWAHFGLEQYADIEAVDTYHQFITEYQRNNNITWEDMTVLGYQAG